MTTKHTPGPWTVDGTTAAKNLDVIGEGGRVAMLDCDDIDAGTLKANAVLIAAAPDLLELARQIMLAAEQSEGQIPSDIVAGAKTIIAKATGQEI